MIRIRLEDSNVAYGGYFGGQPSADIKRICKGKGVTASTMQGETTFPPMEVLG